MEKIEINMDDIAEVEKFVKNNLLLGTKLDMLAEEACELAEAALKLKRALKLSGSPTPVTPNEAYNNLVEEWNDVINSVSYIKFPFNPVEDKELRSLKTRRLAQRLLDEMNKGVDVDD